MRSSTRIILTASIFTFLGLTVMSIPAITYVDEPAATANPYVDESNATAKGYVDSPAATFNPYVDKSKATAKVLWTIELMIFH